MSTWSALPKPVIALSPMADMTDSAFCRIAKKFEAPVVFREMISAEAIVRGNERSIEMGRFLPAERPIIQQLFGSDPAVMAEAVRIIDQAFDPDGFDVNMGCPVYKITSNFNGAALMREPGKAEAIIKAMKAATSKPVSVKLRLGWSDPAEIVEFIKIVEAAGADLVTIHGRTKAQSYSGIADWAMVGRAKAGVAIPVLVNGDVNSGSAAVQALEVSGCAGVLIARGALGNPWIFREIAATLAGRTYEAPPLPERIAVVREHARLHLELYGPAGGLTTFRKHLTWYFRGLPGARALRESLARVTTMEDLERGLSSLPAHS